MTKNLSPIEQLEVAVNTVPPEIELARSALDSIAASLTELHTEKRSELVQKTAELATRLAGEVIEQDVENSTELNKEFTTHANTYNAISNILNPNSNDEAKPTQTQSKSQTGRKR